ncbi:MAG: hypothetical protein EBU43_00595 [Actinobacteria bacterium]|jgi:hypothetical protein|nr:hypothetical protein [Actinomycetota bacterium]NBP90865.1 hypothetical protein [Actinomycetota bacterium]
MTSDQLFGSTVATWKALLETLIPEEGNLQSAAAVISIDELMGDLSALSSEAKFREFLRQLPEDFSLLDQSQRESNLRHAGLLLPECLNALLNAAYTIYYSHPDILRVIAERTGYSPTPPQPNGYALAPFDERMLYKSIQRAPMWRDPH